MAHNLRSHLRSRENSPTVRNKSDPDNAVEVFCRIRHVHGIIESSSDESSEPSDVNNNNFDDQRIAACRTLDNKTVALNTIDKRNNKVEQTTHYTFTRAFSSSINQQTIFDNVCRPQVDRLISGQNALLFAYGVTGSGKTYTMMGSKEQPGVLPRSLHMIFNSIKKQQTGAFEIKSANYNKFEVQSPADAMMERQDFIANNYEQKTVDCQDFSLEKNCKSANVNRGFKYAVFVSFIEIYNDRVYDLLDGTQRYGVSVQHAKKVREDEFKHAYVDNVQEIEVKSIEEAFQQYYQGKERRRLAQTELNFTSSRSHSIFQIRLVHAPFEASTGEIYQDKRLLQVSRLALVDLAGSERVSRTGAMGDTLNEASNINTSLLALRRCIEALRKNQRKGPNSTNAEYVPFRQKKIVHLFKPFFEGEGKITILICINPSKADANETEHVLTFAESAKKIQVEDNHRQVDMDYVKRRRLELEARDQAKFEKAKKYKQDVQKTIRYNKAMTHHQLPLSGSDRNTQNNINKNIFAEESSRVKSKTVNNIRRTQSNQKMVNQQENNLNNDQENMETESVESGAFTATSTYTVKTSEFELPDEMGPPPPNIDIVDPEDDKTFPHLISWLSGRKKHLHEVQEIITRTMPVHVKNLQDLVHQYENHTSHFRELNDRFENVSSELKECQKKEKRLEAKNRTFQGQVGKLERERQEQDVMITEKDHQIRELKSRVRNQQGELNQRIDQAQKRFKQNTDRAVREATAQKMQQLKKKDAKLAQLKHVLGKTQFSGTNNNNNYGPGGVPKPSGLNSGPTTRSQAKNVPTLGQQRSSTMEEHGGRPITVGRMSNSRNPSPSRNTGHSTATYGGSGIAKESHSTGPTNANLNPKEQMHNKIHAMKSNPIVHQNPLRRRSRSHENINVGSGPSKAYLSHKPVETLNTGTILQPNCKVSKHVHIPTNKDLKNHEKYLLTAQCLDSEGELQTQYLKGDILKTQKTHPKGEHGIAVQFTDVEILKTRDPIKASMQENDENRYIRNSPTKSPRKYNSNAHEEYAARPFDDISNAPSQWTDVATRCRQAVENKPGDVGATVTNVKR